MSNFEKILKELKQREPIFHHPDKFGRTREALESMTAEDFWEVGASGAIYGREFVIKTLLERYNDPNYKDVWQTSDFKCREIAKDNYLLTYTLVQDQVRITRRSTLWRREKNKWLIVYHQGTIVSAQA
ncbi:Uncharacterized protein conserved in bacteria [Legionella busanensis]|uniref:Uncharacterized protein conserved in bacteria n=1 Tax=Legionella busanensis TaxID=190655 RepID=A0A378KDA4_9GAMM|nr:DUF4440 domain-containing protein [Legionella busanensis]STX81605.1 Uncharacterized protein conserved in bacteria [Legionella busanensis]